MIAIDVDGTLLGGGLGITDRTRQAIREALALGVAVTLATGRMYQSALPFARQLELTAPLIAYNGGLIRSVVSDEVYFHQPIDSELAAEVLELCRRNQWHIQSYVDDELYVYDLGMRTRAYLSVARIQARSLGRRLYSMRAEPTKLLMIDEPDKIQAIAAICAATFKDRLYITASHPKFLEFTHPLANKGEAVARLAARWDIPASQVMAVGDSHNDISMLEYAGLGVAMGNADEAVKKAARAVTGKCGDDGVAQAIEKYVLGR